MSDRKFRALEKETRAAVGKLAAGYNAAAQRLGVAVSAWIKRHGSKYGTVRVTITSKSYFVVVSNRIPYARAQCLHHLAESAAWIQENKFERRMD
ncbi:hypothetical protein [Verrucomicrobium spinosum]|uniref:hypothetical protein n=1 Tax=Verrucomicrobium spinosum TaxID=2736 RepID=UPI0001746893|nr:hypothetical protein [Verrucomicrobium spinosum]